MTTCNKFYHDHETLEEFVRALAKAAEYNSWELSGMISNYWKAEAEEWAKELEAQALNVGAPTLPACLECGSTRVVHKDDCSWFSPNDERVEKEIMQTSGPQCKKCGAFTTQKRVDTTGLCMGCELEAKT